MLSMHIIYINTQQTQIPQILLKTAQHSHLAKSPRETLSCKEKFLKFKTSGFLISE